MRASTLGNNILAINREIDSRYDAVIAVRDRLPEIELVAGMDIDALIAELENAQDFTGITVISGAEVVWDAVNKVLTIPRGEKGVKGDKGLQGPIGLTGPQGPRGAQGIQGIKGDIGPQGPRGLNGPRGEKGLDGNDGEDLTVDQILYNYDGTFTWLFSDGTAYITPDLRGPKGDKGDQGVKGDKGTGIHHIKGTSTTDPEGDFGSEGEKDTYTMYADANEEWPLGWFVVQNGSGAYSIAIQEGYNGTKKQFYNELSNVREYSEDAASAAASANADKLIVAADKDIVLAAKDETITAKDIAVESADVVQTIFLGAKSVDPTTDNDGSPLITGVMYYNDVLGTLKIWTGTEWTAAAFSADGAVFSFNGRTGAVALTNSDVTIAVGKNLSDAIKYSEADKVLTDVNKLNLSIDTNLTAGIGQMTWSPDERTVNIGLDNNVVLQTGQEMLALVRNGTVSTITNGTVVMLTGSIGNSGRLVVAPYDGVADASLILGITTEPIAAGADGFVTSYGKVRGIDTSMWADGNVLYVNGSGLSTTPTNTLSMKIAVVVHAHVNGTLMVRVDGYSQVKEW